MNRYLIAPSILTADFGRLKDQVQEADTSGPLIWHLDVMDGHFVPPISFGTEIIKTVAKATDNLIEIHAMVAHPTEHFDAFTEAGASRLIFHYEAAMEAPHLGGPGLGETVLRARETGSEVGIAINPGTRIDEIEELLPEIQQVTVMLIRPGWGGQQMNPKLLDKVRQLQEIRTRLNLSLNIEVDGGIKPNNAKLCIDAGANILVAGSAIFNQDSTPQQNLAEIKKSSPNLE